MSIERLARRMRHLPTLPDVAVRASSLLEDLDYDVRKVAALVERDPVLATRLVGLSNSAFYSGARPVRSVRDAVVRLGQSETRSALLSVAIMSVLPELPAPLEARSFWSFGMASAVCARHLSVDLGCLDRDAAHLGGLVHALGEAFLAIAEPDRFARAWQRARAERRTLGDSLRKEFEVAPTALCALVLQDWGLPDEIVAAVRESDAPDQAEDAPELALVIWTASRVCRELGLGLDPPGDERNRWVDALPSTLQCELRQLGYDRLVEHLESREDFPAEVRRLGRLLTPVR